MVFVGSVTTLDAKSVEDDVLLTVREVARLLRVDGTTVRRWIKDQALPAIELPRGPERKRGGYRVRKSTLNKVLQPAK